MKSENVDDRLVRESDDVCGGMKHCVNRSFDASKPDCQECLEDVNRAIENARYDTWD